MVEITTDPEVRIIEAANKMFLKYGIAGTTMSQIADEAQISRTSLHYYFRSKTHLFQKVIIKIQEKVLPTLTDIIESETSILHKIEMFVNAYIDLIIENPTIPGFIFMEMQRDASWIIQQFSPDKLNFDTLKAQIDKEIQEGKINPFKLEDLFANMVGMSVFPLLGKPVFMEHIFDHDEEAFHAFMLSRKKDVMTVIKNWLEPA